MKQTVKQKLIGMLVLSGMFNSQAERVMDYVIIDFNNANLPLSWNAPADQYPEAMYDVVFATMKPSVLNWIDSNIPQAWFRPMFAMNKTELKKMLEGI